MVDESTKELAMIEQMNMAHLNAGKVALERLREQTKDPMKYQEEFLLQVLKENANTEYGKKYHFDEINSIDEYRQKVPVACYDDFFEYIFRETDKCEEHLLCADETVSYNKTSGTIGLPKRIPVTQKSAKKILNYGSDYLYALITEELGDEWIHSKACNLIESSIDLTKLNNGKYHGAVSALTIVANKEMVEKLYTSPIEAIVPKKDTDTYYLHSRFALEQAGITYIRSCFSSYLLRFLQYIEKNYKMLIEDIRTGTVNENVKMDDDVRESIQGKIKPNPKRAEELEYCLKDGFNSVSVKKVWPRLMCVVGTGTAAFEPYYKKIHEKYLGDIPHYMAAYGSSEGLIGVNINHDNESSSLIPDSVFYEFLPLDAEDDFSKIVSLDGLEEGKEYEVIITNMAGFYRYRMRDAIKVTGMYNNTPTIRFLYRIDRTVSIMGEKTTEVALQAAATNTEKHFNFDLNGFSVYPDVDSVPPRYVYYMEIPNMPCNIKPKEIRKYLENQLAIANPSMGDKMKRGICDNVVLNFLDDESYALYNDIKLYKGGNANQQKPVTVITNEMQRKFFNGMTDYSAQVFR